jgi:hypothetical protein
LVEVANEDTEIIAKIKELEKQEFSLEDIENRKQFLSKRYSTKERIDLMVSNLF